jgi:tetratricopeptide (TPR) repeat protein
MASLTRRSVDMGDSNSDLADLLAQARDAIRRLSGQPGPEDVAQAKALVQSLRNKRQHEQMAMLAEAVSRIEPGDATNRRFYAQALIETGKATAAIDLLRPLLRLPKNHPERAEASGLTGRAYKQIFFDAGDKTSPGAREALKQAIDFYRTPFEDNPARNTWQGVNLLALLTRARRLGYRMAPGLDPRELAKRVVLELERTPENQRDEWYLPTLTEAYLGLNDWPRVEENLRRYTDLGLRTEPFLLASTLRQFTEVWDLEQVDERGKQLVAMLRARLACAHGGGLELTPQTVRALRDQKQPDEDMLQAVLGPGGLQTFVWWNTGVQRAASVASIRRRLGSRKGTGFLVRAGDLGFEPGDELLLLTNYHVVNADGKHNGLKPNEAEATFEAVSPPRTHGVAALLWSSPVGEFDAAVLRLQPSVTGLLPLPLAPELPMLATPPDTVPVYVIGHPAGGELSFSFRGNDLIDHEGPTAGRPPNPARLRLHYTATTEIGSSGSPVFNSAFWEVIALHHAGLKSGIPRLNQKPGEYGANEGIALSSIAAACRAHDGERHRAARSE